ncbi:MULTISPECIES: thioredoxin family protein [Methylosinus]|uniref:Thioredoxin n=1 Tax=Methylosinus trichosporium (strain ATCC 35070 / NCIMB 11131 / UNIQEM 75 / OB3b) TaxID=595536 RepID=A0A2D2CX26_METT3|nr:MULTISPECIES: thioredoxin family protein [Methylosinus]ATQ67273.1 thioredoxin [Methylosinus trichosporium OB3b]OBS52591.1 thiol reductase thioredoxin [Methylosinus sp. 3S-1]
MPSRFALALAAAVALVAAPLSAAERHAYTAKAFDAAQAAGKPILVEVHAPWCPTCKAQEAVLEKLEAQPKFASLQVFRVDFDSQKDALTRFRAGRQSTLIAYHGKEEKARSTGETREEQIAALLGETQ